MPLILIIRTKQVYNNESMVCKCMTRCNETSVVGGGDEGDGAVTSEISFKIHLLLYIKYFDTSSLTMLSVIRQKNV